MLGVGAGGATVRLTGAGGAIVRVGVGAGAAAGAGAGGATVLPGGVALGVEVALEEVGGRAIRSLIIASKSLSAKAFRREGRTPIVLRQRPQPAWRRASSIMA